LNSYFEELTNRSISNFWSFCRSVWESKTVVDRISKRTSKRHRSRRI